MKHLPLAGAMLVLLFLLIACGGSGGGRPISVTGSVLILNSSHFEQSGQTCRGVGTFSGVRDGASVKVDGNTTANLAGGSISEEGNCRFLFEVEIPDKEFPKRYDFRVEGMPSVTGIVNTENSIYWQSPTADGWVTIGWDS